MFDLKKNILEYRKEYDDGEISKRSLLLLSAMAFAIYAEEAKSSNSYEVEKQMVENNLDIILKNVYEKNENESWFDKLVASAKTDEGNNIKEREYIVYFQEWRTANNGHFKADVYDTITELDLCEITAKGLQKIEKELQGA